MPKVSEEHLESRRNHILEAAARCFARSGFQGTTIQAICDEAELSTGALYRYFASKNEIITAIAAVGGEQTRDLLDSRQADHAPLSLAEMLEAALELTHSAEAETSNRLSLLLWGEALHTPIIKDLFLESLAGLVSSFATQTKQGQQNGELNPSLDPEAAGRVLAAFATGFTVLAALNPKDPHQSAQVIRALLTGEFTVERSHK